MTVTLADDGMKLTDSTLRQNHWIRCGIALSIVDLNFYDIGLFKCALSNVYGVKRQPFSFQLSSVLLPQPFWCDSN